MSEKLNCANCCIADFKENLCDCDGGFCKEFKGIGSVEDFENAVMERIRSNGRWNWIGFNIECSLCGFTPCFDSTEPLYNYCPNCGAKMEVTK
jgi:hypothetical protein